MGGEMMVELHARSCSCRGGSWMVLGDTSSSPCGGETSERSVQLPLAEWRSLGKPPDLDTYVETRTRVEEGNRREFQRFTARIPIRLSRLATWRTQNPQIEETETLVIARGGALVRSRMAIDQGDVLVLQAGDGFSTRAEVVYVAAGSEVAGDAFLRVGLRFQEALFPDALIPPDAEPV
jgi:hypothetical protein